MIPALQNEADEYRRFVEVATKRFATATRNPNLIERLAAADQLDAIARDFGAWIFEHKDYVPVEYGDVIELLANLREDASLCVKEIRDSCRDDEWRIRFARLRERTNLQAQ